jgi:5-methyltetrahydropteroyltriglutamate--homocysteine methyltransferase
MAIAANLGFPRIGAQRELKRAVEGFWAGDLDGDELEAVGRQLRQTHWSLQQAAGIDHIPSNDFSYYDHVLDTIAMAGGVPERYRATGQVDLPTYFAMARGTPHQPAMEMTKWFDTNYHYLVPEFEQGMAFQLGWTKPVQHFREAMQLGIRTRPVLVGPVSFLLLGKSTGDRINPLTLLNTLLPVYEEMLGQLAAAGAEWIQIDEPALALDLTVDDRAAFPAVYERLAGVSPTLRLCLATYFGDLLDNLEMAMALPVDAVHLDLVRGPEQLERALPLVQPDCQLSLGVIDGRNIWRADLDCSLGMVERAAAMLDPDRIMVAPSCSLLHCPIDLDHETALDAELRTWLAFATQKLAEVAALTRAVNEGRPAAAEALAASRAARETRAESSRVRNADVQARLEAVEPGQLRRGRPFHQRKPVQQQRLRLPPLPTTTIGSFPQTSEVRKARAAAKRQQWSVEKYEQFCREEIERTVRIQEGLQLDVLVHGEFERNDMVEYFGEQLDGFAFTQNGWVQSYGSRCVKPPIIFGDVSRPKPMTVRWSQYAQSLTDRPMKGMLTGPITILQWSFVRDDQPRRQTAFQIALAIRDETRDLEAAGIAVIQIDEPALREGLPLHRAQWSEYLQWAVDAFRLASCGVSDETQIHTHMCYAEFNHIIEAIAALDADVISIEASRSQMDLLEAFTRFEYPNDIGPGVYDIHSPRVPQTSDMLGQIRKALRSLRAEQLWINPDCGLKTRAWPETTAALGNMVQAAKTARDSLAGNR